MFLEHQVSVVHVARVRQYLCTYQLQHHGIGIGDENRCS